MEPRMDRYMRDRRSNMGGRDGRNPYGSRGGYVTSRRPRGRDRMYYDDRTMGGDGGYYEGTFRGQTDRNMYDRYDRMHDNFDDRNMDMDMDYAQRVLNDTELNEWKMNLMSHINDSSKSMLSDEAIVRKAREMGVMFDKYSELELIVATLMMYTDYCKVVGKGSFDKYVKMADAFLCDEDAAVWGGEKLAVYHDCIVMGE